MPIHSQYHNNIEVEMGGLECEEQMYLTSDWKSDNLKGTCSPHSYHSEDERTPSPPMYPGSSGTPSPPQYGSPCSSDSSHYPMYTTLENSNVSAMDNLGFEADPLTWRDRQPCMWTQNDVLMWLIHLNQNPLLPTRSNNKDLELAAFANMTGADLVQMQCKEYLNCDPANAMFIYLELQREISNKQPMRPQDYSTSMHKPENFVPSPNPALDSSTKLESLDLKLISFDTNETFNSIRSIKNEPEPLPTMAQFQNYQPEMVPTPTPSPQMSPQHEAAMPPQPMYFNQPQLDRMFYQHPYYQPLPYSPYSAGHINGYSMTEIKGNHLWEFVRDLLLDTRYNPSIIRWEDREKGIFRFVKSDHVAKLWGLRKNNPAMTYEKLSRAMRYYYQRKILERIDGKRLVYKFGPMATGWKSD